MKPDNAGHEVYSNFGHTFSLTTEEVMNSGKHHQHSAWDFCGYIWYEKESKRFHEEVWVYHNLQKQFVDASLESLIETVNLEFGDK